MKEKAAIIFVGIQASGKTSFFDQRFSGLRHINLDTLHTRKRERLALEECMKSGESFVVDNTNPTREDRRRYIGAAKENGYTVKGYYFSSSVSECIRRNRLREGKARVPDKAVANTYNRLEIPSYDEGFDELCFVRIEGDTFKVEEWAEEGMKK